MATYRNWDLAKAQLEGRMYYTGKPCSKCEQTLRYVSTYRCVKCIREQSRAPIKVYKRKREQTYVLKDCKHCGKQFRTFPSRISRGLGTYCSRPCAAIERAYKRRKEAA